VLPGGRQVWLCTRLPMRQIVSGYQRVCKCISAFTCCEIIEFNKIGSKHFRDLGIRQIGKTIPLLEEVGRCGERFRGVEGTASEAQVDVLYRQIGQLKVENDFLARKLGK